MADEPDPSVLRFATQQCRYGRQRPCRADPARGAEVGGQRLIVEIMDFGETGDDRPKVRLTRRARFPSLGWLWRGEGETRHPVDGWKDDERVVEAVTDHHPRAGLEFVQVRQRNRIERPSALLGEHVRKLLAGDAVATPQRSRSGRTVVFEERRCPAPPGRATNETHRRLETDWFIA